MEINIKMMTEEAFATLSRNYSEAYQCIKDHPSDCTWLKDYLGFEPFEEKKYTIENFELENDESYDKVAFKNGIVLYEHLKDLPRYIICNCRFWAWITFEKGYRQAVSATKLTNEKNIKNIWLGNNSRRSLMLGALSRGYFMTEISAYDALDRQDKYELTKILWFDLDIYRAMAYRNIFMLKNVCLGVLESYRDYCVKYDTVLTRKQVNRLMVDVSRIGSVMLIDIMSKDEIYNILMKKLEGHISLMK